MKQIGLFKSIIFCCRLNSTHVFLGGGFAQAYSVKDPLTTKKKTQPQPSVDIVSGGGAIPRRDPNNAPIPENVKPGTEIQTVTETQTVMETKPENVSTESNPESETEDEIDTRKLKVTKRQSEKLGGGIQFSRAWMFDGYQWNEIEDMAEPRDRPACSLVQLEDGAVRL
jgi:hypothetical protein